MKTQENHPWGHLTMFELWAETSPGSLFSDHPGVITLKNTFHTKVVWWLVYLLHLILMSWRKESCLKIFVEWVKEQQESYKTVGSNQVHEVTKIPTVTWRDCSWGIYIKSQLLALLTVIAWWNKTSIILLLQHLPKLHFKSLSTALYFPFPLDNIWDYNVCVDCHYLNLLY